MSVATLSRPASTRSRWGAPTRDFFEGRGGRLMGPLRSHGLGAKDSNAELLGISILSALSIAGIHSAINPSVFTFLTFASKPEARGRALKGLWIGLGASTVASGAIYMVFKEWLPAIISEVTAIALFGIGVWAINQPPTVTIPSIENQGTEPATGP